MHVPENDNFRRILAATGQAHQTGSQHRELLSQSGLLMIERVRDPIVIDAIVVSIAERARVLKLSEFRDWLRDVQDQLDTHYGPDPRAA